MTVVKLIKLGLVSVPLLHELPDLDLICRPSTSSHAPGAALSEVAGVLLPEDVVLLLRLVQPLTIPDRDERLEIMCTVKLNPEP